VGRGGKFEKKKGGINLKLRGGYSRLGGELEEKEKRVCKW